MNEKGKKKNTKNNFFPPGKSTDTSLILLKPGCKANNCCTIKVSDKPGKSTSETPGASVRSGIT